MREIDRLLANNRVYANRCEEPPRDARPHLRVAVVACMDARLDLFAVLGLADGDAHMIRNAGGVVTDDVIRSLMISQRLLGTRDVILIHHDKCGLQNLPEEEFLAQIRSESGIEPDFPLETFADPEASVRKGIRRIHENPLIPFRGAVRGFIFEHATGLLNEVGPYL